ncbi:MAG TPA: peptidoglycan-binding domain-containing protein [Candidatus Krumholzibacteria bacterium]|nr:peptidoglycan-binding domain-containing protein [Candidatus Krumholzibacteria bacterium]
MRPRNILILCVGVLLVTSVALAGGTTPATGKRQPAVGSANSATSAASKTSASNKKEMHHMQLNKEQTLALQNALVKSGDFKGKVDGVFGEKTREALRHYQHTNQLPVTGQPDEKTMAKLGIPIAAAPAKSEKSPTGSSTSPY